MLGPGVSGEVLEPESSDMVLVQRDEAFQEEVSR